MQWHMKAYRNRVLLESHSLSKQSTATAKSSPHRYTHTFAVMKGNFGRRKIIITD